MLANFNLNGAFLLNWLHSKQFKNGFKMNKKELRLRNATLSDNEEKVLEALMEAFFNGLMSFVLDNKMEKGIEILYSFNQNKFINNIKPNPVRIIISPENMEGVYDKINEKYIWPEKNAKNIN
tara:strand:- start:1250 stop:1618 length:369 start_codon:yes stop_codon:yes gene_type:complete